MLARPDPLSEIQNGDVALFRDTPGIDQIGIDLRCAHRGIRPDQLGFRKGYSRLVTQELTDV
jgi:hypothetical protein